MDMQVTLHDDHSVLLVTGRVDTVSVPRLRARILALLVEQEGDVLLDMRRAGPVSDHLAVALTAVFTRAKDQHLHVVVIDDPDGATAGGLRRRGLHFRIPVHGSAEDAVAGVREDRQAAARRWAGQLPASSDVGPPQPDLQVADQDAGVTPAAGSAVRRLRSVRPPDPRGVPLPVPAAAHDGPMPAGGQQPGDDGDGTGNAR